MSTVNLVIEDTKHTLDLDRFMLSEGIALEEKWGLTIAEFGAAVASGNPPMRVIGAMVWLVQARKLAADKQLPFGEVVALLPVESFDTNLMALKIEDSPVSENPTPGGTRTKGTRTTRATSAKQRAKAV